MIEVRLDGLNVRWPDGLSFTFHPLWLRERSFEPTSKEPSTGHRLEEVAFLPLDLTIRCASLENGADVSIAFSDGHACRYALEDLRQCILRPYPDDLVGPKHLWDSTLEPLPWHALEAIESSDDALLALLGSIARLGFALVRGMGSDQDALQRLCTLIGPIRETTWGRIVDVMSIANGYDLSMTGRALEPHVDNPYRLPGPGYIFLHCLESSAEGGESTIVDGFNVAACLRKSDESAFEILTTTDVTFRYADPDTILENYGPLIERNAEGRVVRIRFHNRSDQVIAMPPTELSSYYRARSKFAELVWSDELTLKFKLNPGEAYVVDNFRLLHGRTKINLATGGRRLRQCYMDRDVVSSRQKVLLRRQAQNGRALCTWAAGRRPSDVPAS